ncbi:hypothetical protein JGC56_08400 [Salmonella enterica subsp. enterica serovar Saintpaul]|nr:hypothetical protein [Salmonella enterica subsp. enterica serovar Saintpaul]
MKGMLTPLALLLSGCQATMISYNGGRQSKECPPVVSVTSFGTSVMVTDGSECKRETRQ